MNTIYDELDKSIGSHIAVDCSNHKERRSVTKKWKRKVRRREKAIKREKERTESQYDGEKESEHRRLEALREDLEERKRKAEHNLWLKRELTIRLKLERDKLENEKSKETAGAAERTTDMALDDMAWSSISGFKSNSDTDEHPYLIHRFVSSMGNDRGAPAGPVCPLYAKTGVCRFIPECTHSHPVIDRGRVLLFTNMYRHPSLIQLPVDNEEEEMAQSTDTWMQYDEEEIYANYCQFEEDVKSELEKRYGPLNRFVVCRNTHPQLRGNVYAVFERKNDAVNAFIGLRGRFYDGRQLYPEFRKIPSWKAAICADYEHGQCVRGDRHCPFLHVFQVKSSQTRLRLTN